MNQSRDVTFTAGDHTLAGTLHAPTRSTPAPAVIMVPGSGDSDRDSGVFFPPIRDCFLAHGIAVFSWDKPGIGASQGDWRLQTIRERADEARAAIAWLRSQPEIDAARVGLWGHSQGGWVGPMVAAADPTLWFLVIHSGTGVTVDEQDHYGLEHTLRNAGSDDDEIAQGHAFLDALHQAARRGAPYPEVCESLLNPAQNTPYLGYFGEIDATGWEFFRRNFQDPFDPVDDLTRVTCPTLAVFGERDPLIPVVRSVEILERTVALSAPELVIKVFPDVGHRLAGEDGAFAPGYFEAMSEWLSSKVAITNQSEPLARWRVALIRHGV